MNLIHHKVKTTLRNIQGHSLKSGTNAQSCFRGSTIKPTQHCLILTTQTDLSVNIQIVMLRVMWTFSRCDRWHVRTANIIFHVGLLFIITKSYNRLKFVCQTFIIPACWLMNLLWSMEEGEPSCRCKELSWTWLPKNKWSTIKIWCQHVRPYFKVSYYETPVKSVNEGLESLVLGVHDHPSNIKMVPINSNRLMVCMDMNAPFSSKSVLTLVKKKVDQTIRKSIMIEEDRKTIR